MVLSTRGEKRIARRSSVNRTRNLKKGELREHNEIRKNEMMPNRKGKKEQGELSTKKMRVYKGMSDTINRHACCLIFWIISKVAIQH